MTTLNADQIASAAYAAGFRGNSLATIVAIAFAESGGRSDARGDVGIQTATWGPSIGLWQVRSLKAQRGTGRERDELALTDPGFNARSAWTISAGGTNFKPWSTFTNGAYRRFTAQGSTAQGNVERLGGAPGGTVTASSAATPWVAPPDISPYSDANPGGFIGPGGLLEPNYVAPMSLSDMMFMGKSLADLVPGFAVSGSVQLSLDEIPQVSLTFADPMLAIAGEAWLDVGVRVDWASWRLEVVTLDTLNVDGIPGTQVGLWPRGVRDLKTRVGDNRTNTSAADWIAAEATASGFTTRIDVEQAYPRNAAGPNPLTSEDERQESAWQTMRRMCEEEGYSMWPDPEGVLNIGQPVQIIARRLQVNAGWFGSFGDSYMDVLSTPVFHWAPDPEDVNSDITTLSYTLPRWRGERVRPGMASYFLGPTRLNGVNIIKQVSWQIDANPAGVEVQTQTAKNIKGTNPTTPGTPTPDAPGADSGAGAGKSGTMSALDFVTLCENQATSHKRYSHDEVNLDDTDPGAFDCSELVEWACHQVGVYIVDGSDAQEAFCKAAEEKLSVADALKIPGCLLFASGHVGITMGDGVHTIEARNTKVGVIIGTIAGMGFYAGYRIPGMIYGDEAQRFANSVTVTDGTPTHQGSATVPGSWSTGPNGIAHWTPNY